MNKYKNLIKKNDLKVNKVTIKGNLTIISTPLGQFVLKENKGIKIYDYLLSRGFNYFPSIIDYDNEGILFKYIQPVDYNYNEKARDLVKLLTLLHSKTTYFIDVESNDIIKLYESIKDDINDKYLFYNNLINIIDNKEYPSPNEYLIQKSISLILSAINYCFSKLEEWKDACLNDNKKRIVTIFNNNSLNNVIRDKENIYLLNLENTKIDNPIYDLIDLYNRYYKDLDFISLLEYYEKYFPLLKNEKVLFLLLISIPEKVDIKDIIDIKNKIEKVYKSLEILNFEEEKTRNTHKNENNK
ncbi:MAG: hypothetical protein IJH20_04285 [Bacilli bacterium]|nr:hypothetical protein [Bacilli bacterium]